MNEWMLNIGSPQRGCVRWPPAVVVLHVWPGARRVCDGVRPRRWPHDAHPHRRVQWTAQCVLRRLCRPRTQVSTRPQDRLPVGLNLRSVHECRYSSPLTRRSCCHFTCLSAGLCKNCSADFPPKFRAKLAFVPQKNPLDFDGNRDHIMLGLGLRLKFHIVTAESYPASLGILFLFNSNYTGLLGLEGGKPSTECPSSLKVVPYLKWVLGSRADPGPRQSARRWVSGAINPAVGCHCFPPGPWLTPQLPGITAHWPVPNYTAWWQRQMCVNYLPRVALASTANRDSNLRPVDSKSRLPNHSATKSV